MVLSSSWDSRSEIMAPFKGLFCLGTFQRRLNSTFLVLIPKKGGAQDLKNFRQIDCIRDSKPNAGPSCLGLRWV